MRLWGGVDDLDTFYMTDYTEFQHGCTREGFHGVKKKKKFRKKKHSQPLCFGLSDDANYLRKCVSRGAIPSGRGYYK